MTQGHLLLETTVSSLRIFLLVQLYTAIYLRGDIFATGEGGTAPHSPDRESPQSLIQQWFQRGSCERVSTSSQVIYRCPIALNLAAKLHRPAPELARQIADLVVQTTTHTADLWSSSRVHESSPSVPYSHWMDQAKLLPVTINITDPGWLEFHLDDRALLIWLSAYPQGQMTLPSVSLSQTQRSSPEFWQCYYSYNRCCSLLEMSASPVAAAAMTTVEREILLKCLDAIEQLEAAMIHPEADVYLRLGRYLGDIWESLQRTYTSQQFHQPGTARLGLVILIQTLLQAILQAGVGDNLVKKL
jgi:hypothetical protein